MSFAFKSGVGAKKSQLGAQKNSMGAQNWTFEVLGAQNWTFLGAYNWHVAFFSLGPEIVIFESLYTPVQD